MPNLLTPLVSSDPFWADYDQHVDRLGEMVACVKCDYVAPRFSDDMQCLGDHQVHCAKCVTGADRSMSINELETVSPCGECYGGF